MEQRRLQDDVLFDPLHNRLENTVCRYPRAVSCPNGALLNGSPAIHKRTAPLADEASGAVDLQHLALSTWHLALGTWHLSTPSVPRRDLGLLQVILQPQVGDLLLTHQPAQRVLQLDLLDEQVVLRVQPL